MRFDSLDLSNSQPLYLQVSDIIRQKIVNKEIATGQKLPPHESLCKIFKVSKDTMKDALSDLVNEGYLSCRPRYGTYVISSEPKKKLDLKFKNEVSLVICQDEMQPVSAAIWHNLYLSRIIRGMEEKLNKKGIFLIYSSIKGDKLTLLGKKKDIAGLIVAGSVTPRYLKTIKKLKIPFVLMGDVSQKSVTREDVDIIANDDYSGMYSGVKHLIDLGHRRIVFLKKYLERYSWDVEQLKAFKQAYKDAGIALDESLLIETRSTEVESGYSFMKKFIKKSMSFSAVICNYGEGVVKAIWEEGLRIPHDVSVVISGELQDFTVITSDLEEAGRIAVDRLIERLTNPDWRPERITLPTQFIIRGSTKQISS
jgi:DNA-binding LacI/PurR family transcriptional regulator